MCTYATEILLNEGFSIGVGLLTIPWGGGWRQVVSEGVHMSRERPGVQSLRQRSNPDSKGVINTGYLQASFSPLPAHSITLRWPVQVLLYSWVSTGQGGATTDCGMGWWAGCVQSGSTTHRQHYKTKWHVTSGKPGLTRKMMQRSLCMCGACNLQNAFDSLTFNEIFSLMMLQQASQLL